MAYSRLIKGILVALVLSFLSDYLWHTVLLADFYNARFIAINGVPMSTDFPPFIALFELIGAVVLAYRVSQGDFSLFGPSPPSRSEGGLGGEWAAPTPHPSGDLTVFQQPAKKSTRR